MPQELLNSTTSHTALNALQQAVMEETFPLPPPPPLSPHTRSPVGPPLTPYTPVPSNPRTATTAVNADATVAATALSDGGGGDVYDPDNDAVLTGTDTKISTTKATCSTASGAVLGVGAGVGFGVGSDPSAPVSGIAFSEDGPGGSLLVTTDRHIISLPLGTEPSHSTDQGGGRGKVIKKN